MNSFEILLIGFGILSALIWIEQIILYTALYSLYRKFVPVRCQAGLDEAIPEAF